MPEGRWGLPTLRGEPFPDKPILYFWSARLASWVLGGVSEASLRLPSAMASVAGVAALYLFVAAFVSRRQALLAGGALALQYSFWWHGRAVAMDALLTMFVLLAVAVAILVTERKLPSLGGAACVGLAAGLGFLAKGPVAWVLPGLVLAGYWALTRRLPSRPAACLAIAAGVAVAVAAPWYVWLAVSGETSFLEANLVRESFTRFVSGWDHRRPWWYFLANYWVELAPVGWLVPLAAFLPARDDEERRVLRLAWVWLFVVLVFFSFSDSKRTVYILPAAPAVAMVVSSVLDRWLAGALPVQRERLVLAIAGLGTLLPAVLGVGLLTVGQSYLSLEGSRGWGLALVCSSLAAAGAFLVRPSAPRRLAAVAASVAGCYLVAASVLLPAADPLKSARDFSVELAALRESGLEVVSYRLWKYRGEYAYYSGGVIENEDDLARLRALWERRPVAVLVEPAQLDEVLAALPGAEVRMERSSGAGAFLLTTASHQAAGSR